MQMSHFSNHLGTGTFDKVTIFDVDLLKLSLIGLRKLNKQVKIHKS